MVALDDKDALWDAVPGSDYIDNPDLFEDWERDYAHQLYELGFTHSSEEYDALGLDPDQVHAAREEFFDFMEMEWDEFPWDEWREMMGYED